jgi:hypothetical protein
MQSWRQNCNTLQQTGKGELLGILKPVCSLCIMSTAETGPDQNCVLQRTLNLTARTTRTEGEETWPSCKLSCAKFRANSNCQLYQWLSNFVAPQISTIIRPVNVYTTPPPSFPASQRKVQFCTLLQIRIRLYGDRKNLKISATSLHLQNVPVVSRKKQRNVSLAAGTLSESTWAILNLTDVPTFRNCASIQPHFK